MKSLLHRCKRESIGTSSNSENVADLTSSSGNLILKLANQRKFDEIESVYTSENSSGLQRDFCKSCELNGETPLHCILKFRPPLSTVNEICNWMSYEGKKPKQEEQQERQQEQEELQKPKHPEFAQDCQGRTPLHVAVTHVCDVDVVERLIFGVEPTITRTTAASIADYGGRYALHAACANPNGRYKVSSTLRFSLVRKKLETMVNIIDRLIEVYPQAVVLRDSYGKTPLDVVSQKKRVNHRIIQAFQQSNINVTTQPTTPITTVSSGHHNSPQPVTNDGSHPQAVLFEIPLEIAIAGNDSGSEDDASSIGSKGISYHQRTFEFTRFHEQLYI